MDPIDARAGSGDRSALGHAPLGSGRAYRGEGSGLRMLEMDALYRLRVEVVDGVLKRVSPGNYALGYLAGDWFDVFLIGRSDFDVRQCLRDWVDIPSRSRRVFPSARKAGAEWGLGRVGGVESIYTHFAYSYARSADEAYAKEWRNFEALGGLGGLDNEAEPAPPNAEASLRSSPIFSRGYRAAGPSIAIAGGVSSLNFLEARPLPEHSATR